MKLETEVMKMIRPHEYPPYGGPHVTHEDIAELIERKFRELNSRLDDIEARLDK